MEPKTKPVRIALLFEYATLNGGERSMLACLDWLQTHTSDFEFVAIAPGEGRLAEALASLAIHVIPWTVTQGETVLIDAIGIAEPMLLHANSLAMGRLTGRLADRLSVPTTAHVRDILNLSNAATADLNRNQRLIAVSQATSDHHAGRGLDPARITVVRNGLDLNQFQPRPANGWLHRELQLPIQSPLIATIGQIGLRKGQDTLAAAAPAIVRAVPDVHFLLIGERSSTKAESIAFEQSITDRFTENGLSANLHRLGYRSDIATLLNEVQLVVHPANQEPFGRVLLEAAASGIPVVATDVGGTSEIVVDQITGHLIPPRDPEQLASAVMELLQNSQRRHSMRLAARQRAMTEFRVDRAASQLSEQWRDVIANWRRIN